MSHRNNLREELFQDPENQVDESRFWAGTKD
jgi:hypothetical protein